MTPKAYLNILKGGIFLSFMTFFFVFKDLLFPYITSKQITFNILIEVLLVFWVGLIIKYPEYRPRKSYITWGLAAFFSAVLLTSFTGVDFNLSFWGDIERMLGWFHVVHFFALYLIIITVMRTKTDWLVFLNVSLVAAVIQSVYSLNGPQAYGSIGNTAYVAGYLIFNIYFALILFFNIKNWFVRSLYIISIWIMIPAFWGLHNSGSIVGLGSSIVLLFFLFGVLNKNRKIKIATLSVAIVSVIAIGLVFGYKESGFVQNNKYLRTLTTLVSSRKASFQSRLLSWKAAYKDFPNHPILGTGYGNYATTFDKYFDPAFFSVFRTETYFDRAHNNLVDLVSTTGLLGLFAYLSIFVAVGFYLIRGYRKGDIDLDNFVLITSLVVAYFIQNLAVFDSLITYVSLMMVLGYIYWFDNQDASHPKTTHAHTGSKEAYALLIAGVVMLAVIYQYNVKPWKMLVGTIEGQRMLSATGDLGQVMDAYKTALSYNTGLDRDSRATFIRVVNQGGANLNAMKDKAKAQEVIDYAIMLTEENLKLNPNDSLQLMEYAQLLTTASQFNSGNPEKASYYLTKAEEVINKSISNSPGRIPPYFVKAQIYLSQGRKDDVINTLKYSIDMNPVYADGHCQLGKLYLYYKQNQEGYAEMDKCILLNGGTESLYPVEFVKSLINHYGELQDWPRTVVLYQRYTALQPNDVSGWINMAKLYVKVGDKDKAIQAARKAGELDPGVKDGAEEFIRDLGQ